MKSVKSYRSGFSVVEMLVAAVLLSGAVVTLCAVSSRSLRAVKTNREYELAWEVLERQLSLIDYMGIDEFIEMGEFEGQFGNEEAGAVVYYWQAELEQGLADNLYRVDMTVNWDPEGSRGKISAATVFNGTGTLALFGAGLE